MDLFPESESLYVTFMANTCSDSVINKLSVRLGQTSISNIYFIETSCRVSAPVGLLLSLRLKGRLSSVQGDS